MTKFATGELALPEVEEALQKLLGGAYRHADRQPAFDGILEAEDDDLKALEVVSNLEKAAMEKDAPKAPDTAQTPAIPAPTMITPSRADAPQLKKAEAALEAAIDTLYSRRRIQGQKPTLDEVIEPLAELQLEESPYEFPDGDKDIVAQVLKESEPTEGKGEDEEEDDDDEEEEEPQPSAAQAIDMCVALERLATEHSNVRGIDALGLQEQLRRLRGHLRFAQQEAKQQVTLHEFFK